MKKLIIIALVISSFAVANNPQHDDSISFQNQTERNNPNQGQPESVAAKLLNLIKACMPDRAGTQSLTDEENNPALDNILPKN